MTPAKLDAACRLLYGERWQAALARDIARERETVNRWARGRSPIPKAVERWLERGPRQMVGHDWLEDTLYHNGPEALTRPDARVLAIKLNEIFEIWGRGSR